VEASLGNEVGEAHFEGCAGYNGRGEVLLEGIKVFVV